MRVVNFNIHGAKVPGKSDRAAQGRAWHQLAAYDTDLALVQEAEHNAIPDWARQHWTILIGDPTTLGHPAAGWGSVIAASPTLNLRPRPELLRGNHVDLIYDYAIIGEAQLPDGRKAIVFSVHVPARRLDEYLEMMGKAGALTADESQSISQPGDTPWALDLFFSAIASTVKGLPFIVGGDWNNSRLFDLDPNLRKKGQPPFSTMFFTRARDEGWYECHGAKNEEQSYLKAGARPHQLDHLFCDKATHEHLVDCSVRQEWIAREISDHAPLVTDFTWT